MDPRLCFYWCFACASPRISLAGGYEIKNKQTVSIELEGCHLHSKFQPLKEAATSPAKLVDNTGQFDNTVRHWIYIFIY